MKTALNSSIYLQSTGDFFLITEDGIEIWIYYHARPKEIRRSLLPNIERFIVANSIRDEVLKTYLLPHSKTVSDLKKNIFIVSYYATMNNMRPVTYKIKCTENDKAVITIASSLEKRIDYPIFGSECNNCEISC